MDNNEAQSQYWDLVDQFIDQANMASENMDMSIVLSSLLEASSRYAAFYAANSVENRKEFKTEHTNLVNDFSQEYTKRLQRNFEDYLENYKIYMRDSKK